MSTPSTQLTRSLTHAAAAKRKTPGLLCKSGEHTHRQSYFIPGTGSHAHSGARMWMARRHAAPAPLVPHSRTPSGQRSLTLTPQTMGTPFTALLFVRRDEAYQKRRNLEELLDNFLAEAQTTARS